MEVKKIDTLFHGTKKISHLTSIIKNGFYSSYANEKFAGRNTKILMISFSNIALMEARNQVNYGDYFIGMKREWGIKKELHPVAYTYEDSKFEKDVTNLLQEAAGGQSIMILKKSFKSDELNFTFSSENTITIEKLFKQKLSPETLETLENVFKNVNNKLSDLKLYLKHYIVNDNKNIQRYCYNDREWRFIPNDVNHKILFEDTQEHAYLYIKYSSEKKPHFKSNPLTFNLEDINYIIVRDKSEIEKIISALEKKFTKESVLKYIYNGDLTILSMDKIWNDL